LDVTEVGDVAVVRIRSHRIIEEIDVEQFGNEMFSLVENDKRGKILLNLSMLEFLNTPAVGKMVALQRKVKAQGGVLKLSNLRPKIGEIFTVFKLNRVFDIKEDEADALAAF
jgi:anti-sigma B factor antagonist